MHRNRLAVGICAPPDPRVGFSGWVPEKEGNRGGKKIDTPLFERSLRSCIAHNDEFLQFNIILV